MGNCAPDIPTISANQEVGAQHAVPVFVASRPFEAAGHGMPYIA